MPSWALVLLAPLFRYSPGRDAWILRGIGEKWGPVLSENQPPAVPTERTPPKPKKPPRARAKPKERAAAKPKKPPRARAKPKQRAAADGEALAKPKKRTFAIPRSRALKVPQGQTPDLPQSQTPALPKKQTLARPKRRPLAVLDGEAPAMPKSEAPAMPKKQSAPRRPPRTRRLQARRLTSSRAAKVGVPALAVILAAAALGFAFARSGGSGPAQRTSPAHPSAGVLQISLPAGWVQKTAAPDVTLSLTDEMVAAPSASSRARLVVGRTAAVNPELLPPSLLASLTTTPTASVVTLGGNQFYRYLNLSPQGARGPETVYAESTTEGAVLGVCLTQGGPPGVLGGCEQTLATLRLKAGGVLPLGPIPAYASALNLTMIRLNSARARLGSQLLASSTAAAQAVAAYALAAAHRAAASALQHLQAGPASTANSAVVAALKLDGAAYQALGRAASSHDATAYDRARTSVQRATAAWKAAYSQLRGFGYNIS